MNKINQLFNFFIILPLLLCGLILTAQGYEELPNPEAYSTPLPSLPQEKQLGREFMREVRASVPILDDPIINGYIEQLGNKLVSHTTAKNRRFHFFVVKNSTINAFAGPDAHVGINSGTITAVNSESELAAVMSHEIAHVIQHHIEHLMKTAKNMQIVSMASVLAAIVIGSLSPPSNNSQHDNIVPGIVTASMGGAVQHMINFTKENEIEADNIGMKILYNSAYDPNAMPNFFHRMQRLNYSYVNEVPQFLLTHPVTNDRIAESKNRADQYHFKGKEFNDRFWLIRTRTQVLTCGNPRDIPKQFQAKLTHKEQKNSPALQYGYALALYQNQQITQATLVAANLQQQNPHEVLFQMLAAQLAVANKQLTNAIAILKSAISQNKNYLPLALQYAQTLVAAKQYPIAHDFIKTTIRQYPEEVELYLLLATTAAKNHNLADAYQAKAKAYEITGYYRQALTLLRQALKLEKLTASDKAIIGAKIDRLKTLESKLN